MRNSVQDTRQSIIKMARTKENKKKVYFNFINFILNVNFPELVLPILTEKSES